MFTQAMVNIGVYELLLILFVFPVCSLIFLAVLYLVIRLAVRHGMQDVHKNPPGPPPS